VRPQPQIQAAEPLGQEHPLVSGSVRPTRLQGVAAHGSAAIRTGTPDPGDSSRTTFVARGL